MSAVHERVDPPLRQCRDQPFDRRDEVVEQDAFLLSVVGTGFTWLTRPWKVLPWSGSVTFTGRPAFAARASAPNRSPTTQTRLRSAIR